MAQTATLVVRRDSARDVKMRNVDVYIDGKMEGRIGFGETKSFDVEPGERHVKFDNTWAKKELDLTFADGGRREFVVGNIPGGCFIAGLALAGAGPTDVFADEIEP